VVGAIPFLGDLFDFVWKANRKNARLWNNIYAANGTGENCACVFPELARG
jgi:hypothetical protein